MGRFGESTGAWEIRMDGSDIRVILVPRDYQAIRNLMLDKNVTMTDKLASFESFMIKIIRRDDPPLDKAEESQLEAFVTRNILALFDEAMIVCRLITKEEKEEFKKQQLGHLKKNLTENFQ